MAGIDIHFTPELLVKGSDDITIRPDNAFEEVDPTHRGGFVRYSNILTAAQLAERERPMSVQPKPVGVIDSLKIDPKEFEADEPVR